MQHLVGEGGRAHNNTKYSLRSRATNLLRLKHYLATNQRVIVVAVSTAKGAAKEVTFQGRLVMIRSGWFHCLDRGFLQDTLRRGLVWKKELVILRSWYEHNSRSRCPFSFIFPNANFPRHVDHELWSAPILALKSPSSTRCSSLGILLISESCWL